MSRKGFYLKPCVTKQKLSSTNGITAYEVLVRVFHGKKKKTIGLVIAHGCLQKRDEKTIRLMQLPTLYDIEKSRDAIKAGDREKGINDLNQL